MKLGAGQGGGNGWREKYTRQAAVGRHIEELDELILRLLGERRAVGVLCPRIEALRREIRALWCRQQGFSSAHGGVLRLRRAVLGKYMLQTGLQLHLRERRQNAGRAAAGGGCTCGEMLPSVSRSWTSPVLRRPWTDDGSGVSGRGVALSRSLSTGIVAVVGVGVNDEDKGRRSKRLIECSQIS